MSDELEFKVSSGLKNIIGKDLITDDFIAVFELVKNSYDAKAKNVEIIIENNKIIISDNGKGMSLEELKDKWLFVAYSAKKDGTEDLPNSKDSYRDKIQERRHYAGAKGIGRFSSDRLGSNLTIITKKKQQPFNDKIEVNWDKFEINQYDTFEKIKVKHNQISQPPISYPKNSSSGTILEIENLHTTWNRPRLKQLKHSLEKLINPFSETTDFSIEIICDREKPEDNIIIDNKPKYIDRDKINGKIKNSILEILDIKTTQISVEITSSNIITKLIDRGTPIYHIKENNKDYPFLSNAKIDLYFLNSSAKNNFTRKMGVEVVNFGSVFLFKNGFRVQPFGEVGDDSWGLDYRAQQGYNRYLGTRDLFGKVEILTTDTIQFKEVSSRDGGLVETAGYKQLMNIFKEKGLLRLERYVAGVLWGEGFKKRKYFGDGNEAVKTIKEYRDKLKSDDKVSDNTKSVSSNLGSKLDFIQIIKSLSTNKNIEILDFNKDFINLVNEKLDQHQTKFILDLETIADQTNDKDLKKKILKIEEKYNLLKIEKEKAEKKALQEERKRKEAEVKALKEENARKEAENVAKEEEEKRRKAELEILKKEKERAQAELSKLKAEQKAKEEKEKNKNLSDKLSIETKKNQYLNATRKTLSDDAEQLVHSIDLYVGNASTYVNELLTSTLDEQFKSQIYSIKNNIDKAIKVSQIIIKSNFDYKHINQRINLPIYIKEYLEDIDSSRKSLEVKIENEFKKFAVLNPINLDIVLDNLISNSIKANANKVLVQFEKNNNKMVLYYYDDGDGVPNKLVNNPNAIFELGVRESKEKGSGIGMYDAKKRIESLKGTIEFIGNNIKLKGASFKIKI